MTLYPSLIETLSNELSNDNTNKQYIKISNNMEIPEIVEPKSVVITNPEKISYSIDLKGKSYIAKLCIWTEVEFNGEKEMMWKVYYFQKAFKSIADLRNPHQLVKSYFGSSKGKNTTQDEILQDMKTTTKNPKIVILDLLETADAAFDPLVSEGDMRFCVPLQIPAPATAVGTAIIFYWLRNGTYISRAKMLPTVL